MYDNQVFRRRSNPWQGLARLLVSVTVLALPVLASGADGAERYGGDAFREMWRPDLSAYLTFALLIGLALVVAALLAVIAAKPSQARDGVAGAKALATKLQATVSDTKELNAATIRTLALFLLLIAGGMSFFEYSRPGFFWPYTVTFRPGLKAAVISLLLVSPLYLRNIFKWNLSIYSIISFALILLLFASFVELALGGTGDSNVTFALLGAAVLLSWMGIRPIAGLAWIAPIGYSIYNVIRADTAMGFFGFVYIASGFLGLLLHTGLNPGQLLQAFKDEFAAPFSEAIKRPKQDIAELGTTVTSVMNKVL